MKTHDKIILWLVISLCAFGILSFFVTPKYADGAKVVIAAVIEALGMVLSFKFGVHQATLPAGTTQLTKQETPKSPAPQDPEADISETA